MLTLLNGCCKKERKKEEEKNCILVISGDIDILVSVSDCSDLSDVVVNVCAFTALNLHPSDRKCRDHNKKVIKTFTK